jgi:uncharacterized membrane protein
MEKRIFGIVLTVLGIAGLILAATNFVNGGADNNTELRAIIVYGILGAIFFFAGIGLIRNTREVKGRDEEVI